MKISTLLSKPSNIVGTIHTLAGLRQAVKLKPGTLDFLEIRVDAFARTPEQVLPLLKKLRLPLIVTVRHPLEGAAHPLSLRERRGLFRSFLPYAAWIDVELRSAKQLSGIMSEARAAGVKIILSHHDFKKTPPIDTLNRLSREAVRLKADVFKVATLASSLRDMILLLTFLEKQHGTPVSVMGMGAFGKISRLLFARSGSMFNYGFLDKAQLRGQWPAGVLKSRLTELGAC